MGNQNYVHSFAIKLEKCQIIMKKIYIIDQKCHYVFYTLYVPFYLCVYTIISICKSCYTFVL